MKKETTVEQSFCDVCGNESISYMACIVCGKDFCSKCARVEAIEYRCGVNHQGSGDAFYCLKCDKESYTNGDKLHEAYRKINSLRNESDGFYRAFKKRQDEAEESLMKLFRLHKKEK